MHRPGDRDMNTHTSSHTRGFRVDCVTYKPMTKSTKPTAPLAQWYNVRLENGKNGFESLAVDLFIIIAFKAAIRDFLQSPHSAANCLQHVRSSGPGAIVCKHVQHIERLSRASVMLRATWYEGTAQLLSLTELKSHLFELYLVS